MMKHRFALAWLVVSVVSCTPPRPADPVKLASAAVNHIGAMRNVMWKGELGATVSIDTLVDREYLNGVGPLDYLSGEITIIDGEAFVSHVLSDTTMAVVPTWDAKAPFIVYARVAEWEELSLPDSVVDLRSLESFLDTMMRDREEPFAFKMKGKLGTTVIHVVNLPEGTTVSSPHDAHQGQVDYTMVDVNADVIGFFSRNHAGVFTHHETYLHLHLVDEHRTQAGHVDLMTFAPGDMRLWVGR